MAIALEGRVSDLLAELLADAFVLLRPLDPAGTIAAGAFEPLADLCHHLLVLVQCYSHADRILSLRIRF